MKLFLCILLNFFSITIARCSDTVHAYTKNLACLKNALKNGETEKIDACTAFFSNHKLTTRQKDPLEELATQQIRLLEKKNDSNNHTSGARKKALWGIAQVAMAGVSLWAGLQVHNYYTGQEKTAIYTDQAARVSNHYNELFNHINYSNYGSATSQGKKLLQATAHLASSRAQDYSLYSSGLCAAIYGGYYFGSRGIKDLYHAYTYSEYIKKELTNAKESLKVIKALKVIDNNKTE